jgi:hypothetical protein
VSEIEISVFDEKYARVLRFEFIFEPLQGVCMEALPIKGSRTQYRFIRLHNVVDYLSNVSGFFDMKFGLFDFGIEAYVSSCAFVETYQKF